MSKSIELIQFMLDKEPGLKSEVRDLVTDTPLTRKQKKTLRQKAIESASLSWMPKHIG
ncbi:hypothetical protein [Winogradskyella luteola]|uniref:Uncharacterized protein n=1 Tax=Winogradskyella luteola TaxID=2828330 RepID=A0A9X1FBG6_9FLAO|nr:hypothetical protein [Winogradskyella luteola]MBV7270644.1 hypothetical protein [Winogradskyella luteola]